MLVTAIIIKILNSGSSPSESPIRFLSQLIFQVKEVQILPYPPQGYHDPTARAEIEKLQKEIRAWSKRSLIIGIVSFLLGRALSILGF